MKLESSIAGCLGVLGLVVSGVVSGCGSDGGKQALGSSQSNSGAGGADSTGDGAPGGSTSSGATAGRPGGGGALTGTGGTSNGAFGMPCSKASDCATGLTCLLSSGTEFDGGGISNGLCTMDCSADLTAATSDTSVCQNVDPGAVCLQVSDTQAYCVESCTIGPAPRGTVKCHNRHDMACADPDGAGFGYCKPTCRGDFDCQGRVCDLSDGVCQGSIDATRKLADGSKCNPDAMPDICHGACVGIVEDNGVTSGGFCSGFCKLGETGCGTSPTSSAKPESFCLFGTDQNSDLGDLGFCAELCDCNDDCNNPDFVCTTVQGLTAQVGRVGACGPANTGGGGASSGIACSGARPDGG